MRNKGNSLLKMLVKAKEASFKLSWLSTETKNNALVVLARALLVNKDFILEENLKDIKNAGKRGIALNLLDRLKLNEKRLNEMADSLNEVSKLEDPVGKIISQVRRPNGLLIKRVRVALGVILIIYEARPNVTSDCIGLTLKSGNVSILRGGSEAINSNRAIFKVLRDAAKKTGLPEYTFNLVPVTDRSTVKFLLKQSEYIDLVIPRGGEGLIKEVARSSRIPVIKHYKGICAVYVDDEADLNMAESIVFNAKVQRPGVCNAMETLLVHQDAAIRFLPGMAKKFKEAGVEIRGCPLTYKILKGAIKKAVAGDWTTEFLDLIAAVRVVKDIDEAIKHINTYGSHHSDTIVTDDLQTAGKFLREVDSAAVFHNASTRFTDGYQFGLGAEIGISTDKIHARGPMGLEELTTYKYQVLGNGQIRE